MFGGEAGLEAGWGTLRVNSLVALRCHKRPAATTTVRNTRTTKTRLKKDFTRESKSDRDENSQPQSLEITFSGWLPDHCPRGDALPRTLLHIDNVVRSNIKWNALRAIERLLHV